MTSVNLAQLLAVCVRASLVAQRYVMLSLLQLPEVEAKMARARGASPAYSQAHPRTVLDLTEAGMAVLTDSLHQAVKIDVKPHRGHQDGDAADDLVTTADFLIQAVLMRALSESFPALPFTVAGEEDRPSVAVEAAAEACMAEHHRAIAAMPYEAELCTHVQAGDTSGTDAAVVLCADSEAVMRRWFGIFIDPIDAASCFVGGFWQAPMTLVGITLDGVPITGVTNCIFCCPLTGATGPAETELQEKARAPGLSVVLNTPSLTSPFVVFDGVLIPAPVRPEPQPECTRETALAVCRSSATKEAFVERLVAELKPCSSVSARGAGYRQYHLLKKILKGAPRATRADHASRRLCVPAGDHQEVGLLPAPHAFLYALASDIFDLDGTPLRYPLVGTCTGTVASSSEIAALTDGLVAAYPYGMREVGRRLG
ncbi:hypothetical protein CUR178_02864 [Leishmania enriettii]|uniref:3'(2'),5'-bisphosphate nucleotidase n=1 Tax=Leishmania enriettii TaxID=5663 RepID=A0A836GYT5_LEIEN|nr:hypothetical protein CUR178_02864 [Leishmania enriettii]